MAVVSQIIDLSLEVLCHRRTLKILKSLDEFGFT